MKTFLDYRKRYSPMLEQDGIKMKLIGGWMDLSAYYSGTDGNVWTLYSGRLTNSGNYSEFIARIESGKIRGELLPEFKPQLLTH